MREVIGLMNEAQEILRPFMQEASPGALVYDGERYSPAATGTSKSDPHALAWWSWLSATVGLLNGVEELTERQADHLRNSLCSGMGSFLDFRLNESQFGESAQAANRELDRVRSSLCAVLRSV